jgi:hypothetical protein
MARARRKLEQRCSGALPGFLALRQTNRPTIVHTCRRHVAQHAQIDVARGLAPRAFDFQPWEAAVDGLIYRRARIDGATVAPHPFIPALTGEVVRFPDQCFALAPLFCRPLSENLRHGSRFGKLLCQRLAVAAGQRGRMVFRCYAAHLLRGRIRARRPASRNRPRCRVAPRPYSLSSVARLSAWPR